MSTERSALESRNTAPRQDNLDPALFGQTPSQTVGPFFHYGLAWKGGADLIGASEMGARTDLFPQDHYVLNTPSASGTPQGEVIEIAGRVLDGAGEAIADAMIEIWQANAAGRYASTQDARADVALDPHFIGFGRSATDPHGVYRFRTIRPGRVPGAGNSLQAPHLGMSVFARGVLKRLITRCYFADGAGNDADPVLNTVPEERRKTLIAERREDGTWWLDIVLSGEGETVFFEL
jgi:protocatechuate 3,4-dioxygenase alpha subunit